MLCRTAEKVDEVGLCYVVKKAEPVENEPEVTLRLVFDERRSNLRWRSPLWCARGGVRATSFLDVSGETKEDDMSVRFGTCEFPDVYDTVELGEELASHFVSHSVSGDALDALPPEGSSGPGGVPCVGAKVSLMAPARACWTAETTMEDPLHAGPRVGPSSFSGVGRLAEGGPLPHRSRELPATHEEYIDDF
eukprot:7925011-Pyramimonas_sp.AAC.1